MLVRRSTHLRRLPTCRGRSLATVTASPTTSTDLQVTDPLELYRGLVAQGKVRYDPEQMRALVQIRKLHAELLDYNPPVRLLTLLESIRSPSDNSPQTAPTWPFKRSSLSSVGVELSPEEEAERQEIIGMSDKARSKALVAVLRSEGELASLATPRGFLLTGPPGTGKSLLMDIFFASLPIPHKVRFHYHHFLLSIYSKVHAALEAQRLENEAEERAMNALSASEGGGYPWSRREEMKALALTKGWRAVFAGGRNADDAALNTKEFVLAGIARDLIRDHGFVLAFDEVQLLDVTGAGMINRLLSWYWRLGGVVIATSNRLPQDLYNSGLQKNLVNTFLESLAARCPPVELRSATDYRREQRGLELDNSTDREAGDFGTVEAWKRWGSAAKAWYVRGQEAEFTEAMDRIVGPDAIGVPETLKVYGRNLVVPWTSGGVAKFSFQTLCEGALGPADYITLGSKYHTIILTDVPVLLLNAKNEARRLITLIDSLYETKTRFLVLAETNIENLFFPDYATAEIAPKTPYVPDDIVTQGGANHPFSAERIYEADSLTQEAMSEVVQELESPNRPHSASYESTTDSAQVDRPRAMPQRAVPLPAGAAMDSSAEITDSLMEDVEPTDSLTEEAMSEVMQDLESPYRPNVSSYDSSSSIFNSDEARQEKKKVAAPKRRVTTTGARADPHPSASTPSFKSLSIFTGEEERFAFKRAVSRVFEMDSPEFLRTATWTPLDPTLRTWEKSVTASYTSPTPREESRDSMGAALPLSSEKLSGVLDPKDMRLRHPTGLPTLANSVEINRKNNTATIRPNNSVPINMKPKPQRGVKHDPNDESINPRDLDAPIIKEDHMMGVRDDWSDKAKAKSWHKGEAK